MTTAVPQRSQFAALTEDLQAAWVPDVIADADAEASLDFVDVNHKIEWLSVPKPDGTSLSAPLLPLATLTRLYQAVEPLRMDADRVLSPGVCGYRQGADPDLSYSQEHKRFSEIVRAESSAAKYVVSADVAQFFPHAVWHTVLASAAKVLPNAQLDDLATFTAESSWQGLHHLPAGYADARFLGNLVLARVDTDIPFSFARWVDDYRIFCPSRSAVDDTVDRLRQALSSVGLSLNSKKLRVQPSPHAIDDTGVSLTSVYHPDLEPSANVKAALRSVFLESAGRPLEDRRKIRFVLPRLAAEQDDIAVEWALAILAETPWESPRLVAYLSHFADRPEVRAGVEKSLLTAIASGSTFVACRLAALSCATGLTREAQGAVACALSGVSSPSLWGLLLRSLALAGAATMVEQEIASRSLNPRAVVACYVDLGRRIPAAAAMAAPATADCLSRMPAPRPRLDSIL